jgi:hypothetical protein
MLSIPTCNKLECLLLSINYGRKKFYSRSHMRGNHPKSLLDFFSNSAKTWQFFAPSFPANFGREIMWHWTMLKKGENLMDDVQICKKLSFWIIKIFLNISQPFIWHYTGTTFVIKTGYNSGLNCHVIFKFL